MNLRFLVHIAADLHQPFHTNAIQNCTVDYQPPLLDGSKIPLFYQDHQENLHFFTDRVADAIENPFKLPFSPTLIEYIHQQSRSISSFCEVNEQSIWYHSLYEWIRQSNEVSRKVFHLAQQMNLEGSEESNQPFVKEMQDLLLHQVC